MLGAFRSSYGNLPSPADRRADEVSSTAQTARIDAQEGLLTLQRRIAFTQIPLSMQKTKLAGTKDPTSFV
jgi:hypothetical protein